MPEDVLTIEMFCRLLQCVFLVGDENLTVVQATVPEWVGRPVEEVLPFLQGMEDILRDLAHRRIPTMHMPHVSADDLPHPLSGYVDVYMSPCSTRQGFIIVIRENAAAAHVIRELTQQRNELALLREQLEAANRRLRELDEERSFLIAMINHDIRAPLATITTGLSYLLEVEKESLSEEHRRILEMSLQAAQNATNLANRILQVERTHHLNQRHKLEPIDLIALLRSVLNQYRDMAEEQNISLFLETTHPEITDFPLIWGNWQSLREAFANLVENAIKYNVPGGEVRIAICPSEQGISVTIQDTGIGIALEDREQIFLPFHRGRRPRTERPGTGLGLYITRQVIKQHQGDIHIESELHKGTTIYIWLPLEPPETAEAKQGTKGSEHVCQDKRPIDWKTFQGYAEGG